MLGQGSPISQGKEWTRHSLGELRDMFKEKGEETNKKEIGEI
jgi:hypothetical protein